MHRLVVPVAFLIVGAVLTLIFGSVMLGAVVGSLVGLAWVNIPGKGHAFSVGARYSGLTRMGWKWYVEPPAIATLVIWLALVFLIQGGLGFPTLQPIVPASASWVAFGEMLLESIVVAEVFLLIVLFGVRLAGSSRRMGR